SRTARSAPARARSRPRCDDRSGSRRTARRPSPRGRSCRASSTRPWKYHAEGRTASAVRLENLRRKLAKASERSQPGAAPVRGLCPMIGQLAVVGLLLALLLGVAKLIGPAFFVDLTHAR